jgi:hypothetical protein
VVWCVQRQSRNQGEMLWNSPPSLAHIFVGVQQQTQFPKLNQLKRALCASLCITAFAEPQAPVDGPVHAQEERRCRTWDNITTAISTHTVTEDSAFTSNLPPVVGARTAAEVDERG